MRVQTKIFLLLLLVSAVFVGGLLLIRGREHDKFRQITAERAAERERAFDEFLNRRGEPLEVLARDSTYWDDMVRFVAAPDPAWIEARFNEPAWQNADADAVWVYRPDRRRAYSKNRLDRPDLQELPVSSEVFNALDQSKQRLLHFFFKLPQSDPQAPLTLMEVRAATVHPSADNVRQTPPRGFLFVGKYWGQDAVKAFARDTDNAVRLLPPDAPGPDADGARAGRAAFTRALPGWDGVPVARLLVRNDLAAVRELRRAGDQLLALLIVFAVVILVLLSLALTRWVSRPLGSISQSLKTERLAPLDKLAGRRDEFGGLARLVREFFGQRESLLAEIRERQQAQEALRHSGEQLRQAQKMEAVGRLAGGVAHDFNNLLTAILGYAELLAARRDLDPGARQHVETIQKAGRQAAAVTHQLLAFSRKQMLQPRVIELGALVHDFEKILRRVIGEHIELTTQTAQGGRVRADPNQMEQVILNLGVNARDAMPKGGQLRIRTGTVELDEDAARRQAPELPPGRYALLEVSDTGHGMDEETQARIFEPFFTTKGPGKGTGLGLSTVYGVVRQSGGTVSVESAPGEGCTFRICLPLEDGEAEDTRPKTVAPTQTSARQAETILVVEDEEIVRDLVCSVLSEAGYEVKCAPNGAEALRLSDAHPGKISLLLTDVVMPQMGGLELARAITLRRPEMLILYVSGYSESDMNDQGIPADELEFLEKPFTPQALKRKVRELLHPTLAALPVTPP